MQIDRVVEHFSSHTALFSCPLCQKSLSIRKPASFVCEGGHCFDFSKKGYINFAPQQKQTKYDKSLFECRRSVLEDGFYDPLLLTLGQIISDLTPTARASALRVLDAGCGDGFYTRRLATLVPATYLGLDLERDAVALASGCDPSGLYLVGNLAALPIADSAIDVVLNILTPANYEQFERVLAGGGSVIKVIPGRGYLAQIRSLLGKHFEEKAHTSQDVVNYLGKHLSITARHHVQVTHSVTPDQAKNFIRMTPMTFDMDLDTLDISPIKEITLDLDIVVAKRKA